MNKRSKIYGMHIIRSLILTIVTGLVMIHLLQQTELPAERLRILLLAWLFPLMSFVFSILPLFTIDRFGRPKALYINQWFSVWVIPFLLLGVSWSYFGSWQTVFSIFHWIYFVAHLLLLISLRQPVKRQVKLGYEDFIILFAAMFSLTVWRLPQISIASIFEAAINTFLTVSAALLLGLLSEKYSGHSYSGSIWQRWLVVLTMLSAPFLATMTDTGVFHVFCVVIASSLLCIRSSKRNTVLMGFLLATPLIILIPVVTPSGLILSIWISSIVILRNRRLRILEGILIPTIVITLLLVAILLTIIRYSGMFPPVGGQIYPISSVFVLFSAILDRTHGLMPVMPWVILPIAGWLIFLMDRKTFQIAGWLGFPLVLIGLTLGQWLQYGQPIDWTLWLLLLPLLLPFYGFLFRKAPCAALSSLIRVVGMLTLLISGIIYVYGFVTNASTVDLAQIAADYTAITGLEISSLFPLFSYIVPGYTAINWIWIAIFILILLYTVLLGRISQDNIKPHDNALIDLLYLSAVIAIITVGILMVQRWHTIPLPKEILITPGQTRSIDNPVDREVVAIKIVSDLSRSTHLAQEHPVAVVSFIGQTGDVSQHSLLAGIHTAEWAYNRPDVLRSIRHQRPETAWSWKVEEPDGFTYQGLTYRGVLFLPYPKTVKRIDIHNPETHETGHVISVKAIGVRLSDTGIRWNEPRYLIDEPQLKLEASKPAKHFSLSGEILFSNVVLHSALVNSAHLTNGQPVGQLTFKSHDGLEAVWIIRAGIETAEWSWSRPDMLGRVRHNKPKISHSERKDDYAVPYLSHTYFANRKLQPPMYLQSITIEYILPEDDQIDSQWTVSELILF